MAKLNEEIDVYRLFRDYIRHEDQLINNRMTWMLTIHGFLYATYGLTLQKMLEIFERAANEIASNICHASFVESYVNNLPLMNAISETKIFLYCICGVGMVISGRAFQSIRSAYNAVHSIRDIFESSRPSDYFKENPAKDTPRRVYKIFDQEGAMLQFPLLTGGGRPKGAVSGFGAAWSIPAVLFVSWIISGFYIYADLDMKYDVNKYKGNCISTSAASDSAPTKK